MSESETGDGSPRLELRLEASDQAPAEARASVRGRFSALLSERTLGDLLTVVTELVANSVVHGPGAPIDLSVAIGDDGMIRGEVEDRGEGRVAIRETAEPGTGGLGLRLVDSLTERWGVHEGSTHVWFDLRGS
jgi:anti-sigma regulatory factor (Ser/Thr protein kinase)